MRRMALAVAVVALAACGERPPMHSADGAPQWGLEPIATLDAPADTGWIRLKDVVADRAGNAYVLDEGASQIRVFDSTGAPRGVIGRRGAGPAEFASAFGMGLGWIGDTLAVLDPGNGRLSRLTRSGQWVGSWPVKRMTGSGLRLHQASTQAVYAYDSRRVGQTSQSLLVGYTAGGPEDSIVLPERPAGQANWIECPVHNGISFFDIPFAWGILNTPGPHGELVTARTDQDRIAIISPKGDTLRIVARNVAPVAVTDSEWTAGLEPYTDFRVKNPAANCTPASPARVRVKPILRSLTFDDAENLWVEYRSVAGDMLDAFGSAGQRLGTLAARAHDDDIPLYVRAGRLYAITVDEVTGAQMVQSFRLAKE